MTTSGLAEAEARGMRRTRWGWEGTGNVFVDLGFPDAEAMTLKASLASALIHIIGTRKLTPIKAAEALGVGEREGSALLGADLDPFSIEQVMRFLALLGGRVEVAVRLPEEVA